MRSPSPYTFFLKCIFSYEVVFEHCKPLSASHSEADKPRRVSHSSRIRQILFWTSLVLTVAMFALVLIPAAGCRCRQPLAADDANILYEVFEGTSEISSHVALKCGCDVPSLPRLVLQRSNLLSTSSWSVFQHFRALLSIRD